MHWMTKNNIFSQSIIDGFIKVKPINIKLLVTAKPLVLLKVQGKRLHPNFDTDKDGVPDYKDCRPFNPNKHVDELNEKEDRELLQKMGDSLKKPKADWYYVFVKADGEWLPYSEQPWAVDENFDSNLKKLEETYDEVTFDKDFNHYRKLNSLEKKVKRQEKFENIQENIDYYTTRQDFRKHLGEGTELDKNVLKQGLKSVSSGPSLPFKMIQRQRDLFLGKKSDYVPPEERSYNRKMPSNVQPYNPVTKEQSFLIRPNTKAPWQKGYHTGWPPRRYQPFTPVFTGNYRRRNIYGYEEGNTTA